MGSCLRRTGAARLCSAARLQCWHKRRFHWAYIGRMSALARLRDCTGARFSTEMRPCSALAARRFSPHHGGDPLAGGGAIDQAAGETGWWLFCDVSTLLDMWATSLCTSLVRYLECRPKRCQRTSVPRPKRLVFAASHKKRSDPTTAWNLHFKRECACHYYFYLWHESRIQNTMCVCVSEAILNSCSSYITSQSQSCNASVLSTHPMASRHTCRFVNCSRWIRPTFKICWKPAVKKGLSRRSAFSICLPSQILRRLSTLLLGRNYVEQKTEVEIHENVDENDDSDSDEQSEVKDEDEKDDGCDASDQEEEIVAEGEKETDDCKSFKGIATMHFSVLYASDAPPEPGQMPDVIQTLRHKLLSLCWTHKLGLDKQAERHGRRFTQK